MRNLLIVESPAKAKTIQKYLGKEWVVTASVGHLRDLPIKGMGVSPPDHLPQYIINPNKVKTVNYIKKLAKESNSVWLATDDDREGEAIAWHIQQIIGQHQFHRVRFNKVTKAAILDSIKSPGKLNYPYFLAQQARRVLDRYAGYMVSPALTKKTGLNLTAGRVQTVALMLIVEREKEINQFVSIEHFGIRAITKHNSQTTWSMDWDSSEFATDENPYVTDRRLPENIISELQGHKLRIKKVVHKQVRRNPPPPLITSTLQQAANVKCNLDSKSTMRIAQSLYEAGLITYHRTDNPNLSDEAVTILRQYCMENGLEDYLSNTKRIWKAKEGSQEAHEAIRPTDFNVTHFEAGNKEENQVYQLIWQTALCCQLEPAIFDTQTIFLNSINPVVSVNREVSFIAKGRVLCSEGWLKVLERDPTEEDAKENKTEQSLPHCVEGELVSLEKLELLTKSTQPPPRYTPASIVKKLEKNGVGRPSTYADIISGLLNKQYITEDKKKFVPTDKGDLLINIVNEQFCFVDVLFTKNMEEKLDALANGKANYKAVADEFYKTLKLEVDAFSEAEIKLESRVEKIKAESSHPCPKCDGQLQRKKGAKGFFWGCNNYPKCMHTAQDNRGKPQQTHACPVCHEGVLRRIKGNNGFFWGCSQFKTGCKTTYQDKRGTPVWEK